MSNQISYEWSSYTYPSYENNSRQDVVAIDDGVGGTTEYRTVTVEHGLGSGTFAPGASVEITAETPTASERFVNWTVVSGDITLADATAARTYFVLGAADVTVRANFEDVVVTTPPTERPIRVNDSVRVNTGVRTWATGEAMPTWVHGRTYPVIELRTRGEVAELLLGDGINSWIRIVDVTKV